MSWEPEIPIGFSACGVAFGALRGCYSAPAKFFADDPEPDNRIIWYFVPDNREVYEGPNVFYPRSDTPPIEATSAFEVEGPGSGLRLHSYGTDVYGKPGIAVDGDEADFAGLSKREKYWIDGVPPVDPCEPLAGLALKLAMRFRVFHCNCQALYDDNATIPVWVYSDEFTAFNGFDYFLTRGGHAFGFYGWSQSQIHGGALVFIQFQMSDSDGRCTPTVHIELDRDFLGSEGSYTGTCVTTSWDCHTFVYDGTAILTRVGADPITMRFTVNIPQPIAIAFKMAMRFETSTPAGVTDQLRLAFRFETTAPTPPAVDPIELRLATRFQVIEPTPPPATIDLHLATRFEVTKPPVTTRMFDFGTSTSPVASGYRKVTDAYTYTTARGYGWIAGTLASAERSTGSDLLRDFVYGANYAFRVDLEPGWYDVTTRIGDTEDDHQAQSVSFNSEHDVTVDNAPGVSVVRTRAVRVDASVGYLRVDWNDVGGADPNVMAQALEIVPHDGVFRFDFGTTASPVTNNYIKAHAGQTYSSTRGFGFSAGSCTSHDRAIGTDFQRDFVYGADYTFRVDLPNGDYVVNVFIGDMGDTHQSQGIYLQGTLVDSVDTVNEVKQRDHNVTVSSGYLLLRILDLGGVDPNAMLVGLVITPDP